MSQEMTRDEMMKLLLQLKADNTALTSKLAEAQKPRHITLKVSEKGALSLYGIGRFPVTLYRGQWERIFAAHAQIIDFIKANVDKLSVKAD